MLKVEAFSYDHALSELLQSMTQFGLTEDQRQLHEMAQRFTAGALTPHTAEWEAR